MKKLIFGLMLGLLLSPAAMAGFVTATWDFEGTNIPQRQTADITNPQSGFSVGTFGFSNSSGTYNNGTPSNYVGASGFLNARMDFATGSLNTNTSDYFKFSVTTDSTVTAQLSQFDFGLFRANTGPTNFVLRSSKDNYATDLAAWTQSGTAWQLRTSTPNLAINSNETVQFRLYGFGGTSNNNPDARIDDLKVGFNVTAVPEPGSLAVVSGLVAGLSVLSRRRRQA